MSFLGRFRLIFQTSNRGGGGGGVTDHSALTGLLVGDDHTQYHNNARGDARYSLLLSSSALTYTATTDVDFNGTKHQTLALTGDVILTTSNKAATKAILLTITADATPRTVTTPTWVWPAGDPVSIVVPANGVIQIHLLCTSAADSGVYAQLASTTKFYGLDTFFGIYGVLTV